MLVKLNTVTSAGQQGEETLLTAYNDPGKVYIGSAQMIFDVNQYMRDQC